ncbi:hypothetical protein EYZ11_002861 [Aspergillus tanneri]|uniref:SMP-30/Gluconolactonase/LRE-like region domain-containing protein n=1 Tax=Aspergillus tanneri TaxID=1220188 RepID=A0A4S3JPV5_9EURO|nr:hypothetical protein EYZ11_002861 [Aspergillus tanneri]
MYWSQEGNTTTPSAIIQMDPRTLKTQVVKNNFYGHRFNSLNDLVISDSGMVFFSDGYYGWDNFNYTLFPELPNGIYRWDMHSGNIKMVAGAAEQALFNPNGIAHREIFAYVDAGFPDGIKTDRHGHVYAAVTGSVDIFDRHGTLLGRTKVAAGDVAVNMAWAANWLYIFGQNNVYRVELNTTELTSLPVFS